MASAAAGCSGADGATVAGGIETTVGSGAMAVMEAETAAAETAE
jgi:hypothetical protein